MTGKKQYSKIYRLCRMCGNEYFTYVCYLKRQGVNYCSRKCYDKHMKGRKTWITGKHHTQESIDKIKRNRIIIPRFFLVPNCGRKHKSKGLCKKHIDFIGKKREKLKVEVFLHYSEPYIQCACCGEKNLVFLTLDHIIPIKNSKRRGPDGGGSIYYKLKRENYPEGYQILCFNCNLAKGINKQCPHKTNGVKILE